MLPFPLIVCNLHSSTYVDDSSPTLKVGSTTQEQEQEYVKAIFKFSWFSSTSKIQFDDRYFIQLPCCSWVSNSRISLFYSIASTITHPGHRIIQDSVVVSVGMTSPFTENQWRTRFLRVNRL